MGTLILTKNEAMRYQALEMPLRGRVTVTQSAVARGQIPERGELIYNLH